MRQRSLAGQFNARGNQMAGKGDRARAVRDYTAAARFDPSWSVPRCNLGLQTKYLHQREDSLRYNRRACELDGEDEASWWNMGIAATALPNWKEARRAWKQVGVDLPDGDGDRRFPPMTACVRINPDESPVIWGERIDPVRLLIRSIPLPDSRHRYRDILLHDGTRSGTRMMDEEQVPVFDELEVWQPSQFATYQAGIRIPDAEAETALEQLAGDIGVALEDWSKLSLVCPQCSRGNPVPHECDVREPEDGLKSYALAAETESTARYVLDEWAKRTAGASYSDLRVVAEP
jgi:tetratricopeptide (TPR) repeat protein